MYKLRIENFQSLKSISLEISGFTVLRGKTDTGKSSVRRAISSLFYNRWNSSFSRIGTKTTIISIERPGKFKIIQEKSKKFNSYEISIDGSETKFYPKVGIKVPDEVSRVGIKMLDVGDDSFDVMVASQMDNLFIMGMREPEVTKILNSVFRVEKYEIANRNVQRDIIRLKSSIKNEKVNLENAKESFIKIDESHKMVVGILECTKNIESINILINHLDNIKQIENDYKLLNGAIDELNGVFDTINKVNLIPEFESLNDHIKALKINFVKTLGVISIMESIINIKESVVEIDYLFKLSETINSIENNLNEIDYLVLNDIVDCADKLNVINELESLSNKFCSLNNKVVIVNQILSCWHNFVPAFLVFRQDDRIDELKNKMLSIDEKMKSLNNSLPEFCPVCGQEVIHES